MIELCNVTRVYPAQDSADPTDLTALAGVSIRIDSGEFVCITGPSGSGKTTLLSILGCLDRPTAGSYSIAGEDPSTLPDDELARLRRHTFGFVFQQHNLIGYATARENVELPAAYAGLSRGLRGKRARDLLAFTRMSDRLDHRPHELSGGEQQRVAIARALVNDAPVLLADEPTGALDADQAEEVLALLERLASSGRTVVLVSHSREVAARADRRLELHDGRVVLDSGQKSTGGVDPEQRSAAPATMAWLSAVWSGLSALRSSRLRSALTACSISVGILAVVALLGLVEGARRDVATVLENMGANRLSVPLYKALDSQMHPLTLTLEDARAIAKEVANVQSVRPSRCAVLPVRRGSSVERIAVCATGGTEPRTAKQNLPWSIDRGAYLTERDSDTAALVAVIGPRARGLLFDPIVDPVGEHVEIKGLQFTVKGLLARQPNLVGDGESFTTDLSRARRDRMPYLAPEIHIPFRTGFVRLFDTDKVTNLDVFVEDVARIDETAGHIRDLMVRRHGPGRYDVFNEARVVKAQETLSSTYAVILGTLGGVALLVGGLGVMSSMVASVSYRRREIGIRMAVGARRQDISMQFLVETTVLTTIGGGFGALSAIVVNPLLSYFMSVPVAYAPWFIPIALASAITTGFLFGMIPARRAASLDPCVALASD